MTEALFELRRPSGFDAGSRLLELIGALASTKDGEGAGGDGAARPAPGPAEPSRTAAAPPRANAAPPPTPRDLEQVGRAARGEPEAQAWLLAQVMPRVRRVTRAFLKSPADADDAAQLALLAVLRSAATYRGEAGLEAWAKRIAVRTTLRFIETQRRTPSAPSASPDDEELAAPSDPHLSEALPRDVREYLHELPEVQRNAIVLHHALGYSVEEVAALTDASPDTVKGRLKLGTAALRKRIRQEIAIGPRRPQAAASGDLSPRLAPPTQGPGLPRRTS